MNVAIIGANSSLARNFIYYLKQVEGVTLFLYDIQQESVDGYKNYSQIDLLDLQSVKNIRPDCDLLYLFSGLTGSVKGFKAYSAFIDVNEKALLNVLTFLAESGSKSRIIYPSSRLVYKNQEGALEENAEKEGLSIYAINKLAAENYLRLYGKTYGIPYTIFRIAIPFGQLNPAAHSYGIVNVLCEQAKTSKKITLFGEGAGARTFTHIKDVCRVLYDGGRSVRTVNDAYNIGGHKYLLKELAEMIAEKTGATIQYEPWPTADLEDCDVANGWLDSKKLDEILNAPYLDLKDTFDEEGSL